MPTKPLPRITAWSYSRWSTYSECPFKAKLKFVEKLKEPSSKAMERGSEIHTHAEQFVKGEQKRVHETLTLFSKEFRSLKKRKALAEHDVTFRKDWSQTTWNDWNEAWVRIKIDALVPPNKQNVVEVIDYKTGKPKDGYDAQLELYAVAGFLVYPQAEQVRTNLWYLDHGVIHGADSLRNPGSEGIYTRDMLQKLINGWERRVKPMLADTVFSPRPGPYCSWCHFRKANHGPCKF